MVGVLGFGVWGFTYTLHGCSFAMNPAREMVGLGASPFSSAACSRTFSGGWLPDTVIGAV